MLSCRAHAPRPTPPSLQGDYADGSLWVSSVQDTRSCRDSGNGGFVTSEHLGGALSASYDAGRLVSPTAVG